MTSFGVRKRCRLRGRLLRMSATRLRSSAVWTDRSLPLGKYWRSRPLDAPMFVKPQPGRDRNGWPLFGGGLDSAVEASCEGAFEGSPDVAVGLALRCV
jgi:hypothetical protein